jgi:alanine racemase
MTPVSDTAVHVDSHTLQSAPGVLTIDLDALAANWKALESRAVQAECSAVVKADA